MNSWTTRNGYKIIRVLWGRSNAYLVSYNETSILIDTGKASAYRRLYKNLKNPEICGNITHLILTHTHFDHCQSAKQIKEDFQCRIIVSEHASGPIMKGYSKIPGGTLFLTKPIAKLGQIIGKRHYDYPPFAADNYVEDDHSYHIEPLDIKIINTPGHSADSVSIIVNDEIAVVGDAMFGIFANSILPPFAEDKVKLIESWGKLLNTNCSLFLPGHGKAIGRPLAIKSYKSFTQKQACNGKNMGK